jgi:hypothetical protein
MTCGVIRIDIGNIDGDDINAVIGGNANCQRQSVIAIRETIALWYWRVAEKLIRLMNIDAVRLLLIE